MLASDQLTVDLHIRFGIDLVSKSMRMQPGVFVDDLPEDVFMQPRAREVENQLARARCRQLIEGGYGAVDWTKDF